MFLPWGFSTTPSCPTEARQCGFSQLCLHGEYVPFCMLSLGIGQMPGFPTVPSCDPASASITQVQVPGCPGYLDLHGLCWSGPYSVNWLLAIGALSACGAQARPQTPAGLQGGQSPPPTKIILRLQLKLETVSSHWD